MSYDSVIVRFFYLLIAADGKVNEKEKLVLSQMIECESINREVYESEMLLLPTLDKQKVYAESLAILKKFPRKKQLRIVAWLCVLANADGFMDKAEWQFIYGLYQKELHLPLQEIFDVQREINFAILERRVLSAP